MNLIQYVLTLILFGLVINSFAAEDFSFDISTYQKKNYRLGGYLEYTLNYQLLNQEAAASRLFFLDQPAQDALTAQTGIMELNGDYKQGNWQARFNFHAEAYDDDLVSEQQSSLYEFLASYQAGSGTNFEIGKKAIKWGKGYAWNPVGFVERPKNPDEPDLAREGYVVASADLIKSFSGNLKTIAFTPVYLPVTDNLNNDYGLVDHNNLAAKLYLLYKDTDIDIVFLSEGSRSWRYGFDFSRNLTTNFEIHGEWAYFDAITRQVVTASGSTSSQVNSTTRWLFGLRYLTENETTIIAEYYRNNNGYTAAEMSDFFTAVDTAYAASNTSLLGTLASVGEKSYLSRNPGLEYLYIRLSNKEPFDWVYFVPAITLIYNLQDDSYSISPEMIYTGINNLELRFKAALLHGDENTEFAEKRNEQRYELRVRYFF